MNKFIKNSIQYSEYLKNKRVIVCGPGDILTNKNTGKKISAAKARAVGRVQVYRKNRYIRVR